MLEYRDEVLVPRIAKQTLEAGNDIYLLNGIYGENDTDASGKECVICLMYEKDTMILPCRHLSICHSCAVQVCMEMKKCPICRKRTEIASMTSDRYIVDAQPEGGQADELAGFMSCC